MTWLICHCPTDLIVTSTAGSPMVWCARASSASDDRSGSPCAGSYMGDRYSSRRSCFLQKLFLAGSLGSDQGTRMVRKAPEDSSPGVSGPAVSGPRYPVESVAKAAELLRLFAHHSELRLSDVGNVGNDQPEHHNAVLRARTGTTAPRAIPHAQRVSLVVCEAVSRRPGRARRCDGQRRDPASHGRGVRRVGGGADPPPGGLTSGRSYAGQWCLRRKDLAGGAFRRGVPRPLSRRSSRDSDPAEHSHPY